MGTNQVKRAWICALAIGVSAAGANTPTNITAGEIARLPDYCSDAQSFSVHGNPDSPTDRQRFWVSKMGATFWGVHHYCWALLNVNRSEMAGVAPRQRDYLLRSAIADVYYVIRIAPPQFPLMPELLTRVGEYQVKLGNPVEAHEHFERAIQLRPDYWPPYLYLAESNARLGRKEAAVEALTKALEFNPSEPRLSEALKRIKSAREHTSRQQSVKQDK